VLSWASLKEIEMIKPIARTQHLAALFRMVIDILPVGIYLPTCSLHGYVDTVIRRSALPVSLRELFDLSKSAHGILLSMGVEDSLDLFCSRAQATHLMELAALVCEDTGGQPLPDPVDPYSLLRNVGLTPDQCSESLEILEKYFTLTPKGELQ
jgi:hypothetical protein